MGASARRARSSRELARLLAKSDLLPGVTPDEFAAIAPEISERRLAAGDELFAQGDSARSLYVVLSGEVEVVLPGAEEQLLSRLGRGAVVGEIGLLAGDRRSATVRAVTDCALGSVTAEGLRRLLADHAEIGEAMAAKAGDRLRRAQLVAHFRRLFGVIDPELLADIERLMEWRSLPAGAQLFAAGDPGDDAYLVASGRLAVFQSDPSTGTPSEVAQVGRGEIVGELGLMDRQPRNADVYAVRDAKLIRFTRAAYDELFSLYPRLGLAIATMAIRRQDTSRTRGVRHRSFLLVGATRGVSLTAIAAQLSAALGAGARVVTSADVDADLGRPGASQVEDDDLGALRLTYFLEELEERHDFVVFLADDEWTPWSRRALRSSDDIVLVADATTSPVPSEHEAEMWALASTHHHPDVHLVLIHPPHTLLPRGTRAWLDTRAVSGHHHVRVGDGSHVARLSRSLAGTATSLVLGGGGARGFAHLGVLAVLDELGVAVDMIAGTSIGSIMAITPAMGWDKERARSTSVAAFRGLMDYTLPATSLLRGRRITSKLQEFIGDIDITDLWIPYFCVSANITTGATTYHDRGDAVRAIRASIAIPGVLPPVVIGGELFVDGGIVDNVPVEEMRRRNPTGTIIAVDVAPVEGPAVREDYGLFVGGFRAWRDRRRGSGPPSLMTTMVRSSLVSSLDARQRIVRDGVADLFLEVPTSGGGLLDFSSAEATIDSAADATRPALHQWLAASDHGGEGGTMTVTPQVVRTEPPRREILETSRRNRGGGVLLLTARDLQFRAARVAAVIVGIAVVLALLFLMTGLTEQFHREPRRTVDGFNAAAWLLRSGASGAFTSAATMPADTAALVEGVSATPIVIARHSLTSAAGAPPTDIVVVGFREGALGAPELSEGRLPATPTEVVVDAAGELSTGGTAVIGDTPYAVVGRTSGRTMFAGMPLVFMPIEAAQALLYRGEPLATAILLGARPAAVPEGVTVVDPAAIAEDATRPLERSISSVNLIRVLLWLVAALIIGTTTYLSALERRRDVAVLKAIGGSSLSLGTSIAMEGALIALVAAGAAALLQLVLAPVFPLEVAVPRSAFLQVPVIALVVSQIAGVVGLREAVGIDPALAFQGPSA